MMMWRFLLVTAVMGAAACSDQTLGLAQLSNAQDTVVLGALTGSGLSIPSGFSASEGTAVQTDKTSGFDMVYQVLAGNRHVFLPLAAIGLSIPNGTNPGLLKFNGAFTALTSAPTSGYSTTDSLTINVGDVVVVRSRVVCALSVPQYAKLHILSFNDVARTVQLEYLADINCGYRSLEPGIPVQ